MDTVLSFTSFVVLWFFLCLLITGYILIKGAIKQKAVPNLASLSLLAVGYGLVLIVNPHLGSEFWRELRVSFSIPLVSNPALALTLLGLASWFGLIAPMFASRELHGESKSQLITPSV